MTEKRQSLGAYDRYYGMASFTSRRRGAFSFTGKKYKIQAAQKNTEFYRRNSREGGLKTEENRNLGRGR